MVVLRTVTYEHSIGNSSSLLLCDGDGDGDGDGPAHTMHQKVYLLQVHIPYSVLSTWAVLPYPNLRCHFFNVIAGQDGDFVTSLSSEISILEPDMGLSKLGQPVSLFVGGGLTFDRLFERTPISSSSVASE